MVESHKDEHERSLAEKFFSEVTKLEVDESEAMDNRDLTAGEIESLEATLEGMEMTLHQSTNDHIVNIVQLSLVPNFAGKIVAHNVSRGYQTELRRLPALDLWVAVTDAYPTVQAPEIRIASPFYKKYESQILDELNARWSEGMPVLYEFANYIWDEMVDQLGLASGKTIKLDFPAEEDFK